MSCNRCGNTKSSPCACQDHGLITPCSFQDCTTVPRLGHPEHCSEITCIDCVVHCRNTFQAPNGADQFLVANAGDKLDTIIQRMFIFATQPSCWNLAIPHLWHDPASVTSNSITLKWDSIPDTVQSINVQYTPLVGGGAYQNANTTPLQPTVVEFTIGAALALIPDTIYKFRLSSTDGASTCNSVELLVRTLAQ